MTCPYQPCGSNENCVGCCEDPQQRPMTLAELYDINPWIRCFNCIHYNGLAHLPDRVSRCKRLDHKHVKFYTPWFKSYDCDGPICADFQPDTLAKWLYRHWRPEFIRDYLKEYLAERPVNCHVPLILDGDRSVLYHVRYEDYFNGTFLNEDGSLKWVNRQFLRKVARKSSDGLGFHLVTELPPGDK